MRTLDELAMWAKAGRKAFAGDAPSRNLLKASYALSSASTLRLYYTYGHLQGEDYAYEGMQFGGLAGVLPSLETAPDYTVQVVALTYSHRF